jgi:hypothetical protein
MFLQPHRQVILQTAYIVQMGQQQWWRLSIQQPEKFGWTEIWEPHKLQQAVQIQHPMVIYINGEDGRMGINADIQQPQLYQVIPINPLTEISSLTAPVLIGFLHKTTVYGKG